MRAYLLSLSLLIVVAASLSTTLEPWFQNWAGSRAHSGNVIQVALGDSRKLFARHFFAKADAYLHSGYYPSIFDVANRTEKAHMTGGGHPENDSKECEGDYLGRPKDWIDRFGRHFYPSKHTHLEEKGDKEGTHHVHGENCDHDHDHDHAHDHGDHAAEKSSAPAGIEREILPWLRFSASLDPHRVETYVVASYWLRSKLGKSREAEQFLREGLQDNPGDCEILLELGRIYHDRKEVERARSVLELSLRGFRQGKFTRTKADDSNASRFLHAQILNQLALLEREQNNRAQAISYYTELKQISPYKQSIQNWIDWLETNAAPAVVTQPSR